MAVGSGEKGSISVQLVHEALQELRLQGLDPQRLLQQAGIAPELLAIANSRVPVQHYARLWLLISAALDDEFFGMNARRMKSGSFTFMTRVALAEPTVGAALERALEFLSLTFDGLQLCLERQGANAAVVLSEPSGKSARAFCYFTLWLIIYGLACWLAGRRLPINAIDLRCEQPGYGADYRVMFGDNLRFNQPQSRLLLDAECLSVPVRRTEREFKRFMAGAPGNILVKYRDLQSLSARVKAHLRGIQPQHWPDYPTLAQHLHTAPSTLRRKLALEGQSYQSLKDQVRLDVAITRLGNSAVVLDDLAIELGFSECSAFSKAFKKWTGSTPGQYKLLLNQ